MEVMKKVFVQVCNSQGCGMVVVKLRNRIVADSTSCKVTLSFPPEKLCLVLLGEVPVLTKRKQHVEIFCFQK